MLTHKNSGFTNEELYQKYQETKESKYIDAILKQNSHLCIRICISILKTSEHQLYEDLLQEAMIGYYEGIKRYNIDSKTKLNSYCYFWAKKYALDYILKHKQSIYIPRTQKDDFKVSISNEFADGEIAIELPIEYELENVQEEEKNVLYNIIYKLLMNELGEKAENDETKIHLLTDHTNSIINSILRRVSRMQKRNNGNLRLKDWLRICKSSAINFNFEITYKDVFLAVCEYKRTLKCNKSII